MDSYKIYLALVAPPRLLEYFTTKYMVIVFPSIIYEMSHNSTEEEPLGLNISCKNPHNFTRIEVDLQALARIRGSPYRRDTFMSHDRSFRGTRVSHPGKTGDRERHPPRYIIYIVHVEIRRSDACAKTMCA